MNRKTARPVVITIALVFMLAVGAVAWACTPQTVITQLRPLSGPAGTTLTIEGSTPAPIEIRWNPEGPLLASASGSFAVSTAVPRDAGPGVYYLMAGDRALETFEVTGDAQATSASLGAGDLWIGFSSSSTALGPEEGTLTVAGDVRGPVAAGLGLVAVGMSALIGAVALGRKRRVSAHGRSS